MAYTEEDRQREAREKEALERIRLEREEMETAKMREWAEFCKKPPKVGGLYLALNHGSPTGDIFKITAVIHKPEPKRHGSGRYRMDYVGEASARELGEIPHMPLGVFETLGDPGDRLRK